MTVQSRSVLLKHLAERNLIVSPILHDEQIQECAIDLRMGNVVLLARSRGMSEVDPSAYIKDDGDKHGKAVNKQQKLERHEVPFGHHFLLHPQNLALVPTLEWVKLPTNAKGVVTARSSWAREGLSIATATFVNPGYRGIITLELANLGQVPIKLYPGLRLAQIALYDLQYEADAEPGQAKSQFDSQFEPTAGNLIDPVMDPCPVSLPSAVR